MATTTTIPQKQTATVTVSWSNPVGTTGHKGFALYSREAGETTWTLVSKYAAGAGAVNLKMEVGKQWEFAMALIGPDGTVAPSSSWSIQKVSLLGNTDQPDTPTNFTVVQDEQVVKLKWDDMSTKITDLDKYEIRVGSTSWATATKIATTTQHQYDYRWSRAGEITLRLKAVDKYGKYSDETTKTITVTSLVQHVENSSVDEDGASYSGGSATDCTPSGTDLIMDEWGNPANTATEVANTATWLPWGKHEAQYDTAQVDLGSTRRVRIEADVVAAHVPGQDPVANAMANTVNVAPMPRDDDWTEIEDDKIIDESERFVLGNCIAAGDDRGVELESWIKLDGGSWIPYVPGYFWCRYYQLRIVLRAWCRWRRIKLTKFKHYEILPNQKDEGVVEWDGDGTNIPFTTQFVNAPAVVFCPEDSCPVHVVKILTIAKTNATIRGYDISGNQITGDPGGNIHWIAAGP